MEHRVEQTGRSLDFGVERLGSDGCDCAYQWLRCIGLRRRFDSHTAQRWVRFFPFEGSRICVGDVHGSFRVMG